MTGRAPVSRGRLAYPRNAEDRVNLLLGAAAGFASLLLYSSASCRDCLRQMAEVVEDIPVSENQSNDHVLDSALLIRGGLGSMASTRQANGDVVRARTCLRRQHLLGINCLFRRWKVFDPVF